MSNLKKIFKQFFLIDNYELDDAIEDQINTVFNDIKEGKGQSKYCDDIIVKDVSEIIKILGKPDTIEEIYFEGIKGYKRIWNRDDKIYVKISEDEPEKVLTLEEQLSKAIEEENYEEAARLQKLNNKKK